MSDLCVSSEQYMKEGCFVCASLLNFPDKEYKGLKPVRDRTEGAKVMVIYVFGENMSHVCLKWSSTKLGGYISWSEKHQANRAAAGSKQPAPARRPSQPLRATVSHG